ncbi:hypothetical protein QFC22_002938 [Naganishia vaughanmartiniae]|uniref:Uncharacterized protein n=1 Tax=Naganishia vaughanmartiniae TaxID=1424756 RepID=A0ACC2XAE7_9TREE|nr:hypothetical protein QFC22_002938 [Naganishia vaughanmartiniae]
MSSISSTPLVIRPAKDDEYLDIARLHYTAVTPSPMFQLLSSKVDPSAWLEFSAEQFKQAAHSDFSSLLVAQQTDTREIVGIALTHRYTDAHRPQLSRCPFPEGWNTEEAEHINARGLDFKEGFLRKYGEYIYLGDFAVSVDRQGQGIGKRLAEHIIGEAKQNGMNMALTAAAGKVEFYQKLGFEVAGKPPMSSDGTLEGPTPMQMVSEEAERNLELYEAIQPGFRATGGSNGIN